MTLVQVNDLPLKLGDESEIWLDVHPIGCRLDLECNDAIERFLQHERPDCTVTAGVYQNRPFVPHPIYGGC